LSERKLNFVFSQDAAKIGDKGSHFVHHSLHDGVALPTFDKFKDILSTFCIKNNIKINYIHRMAVNITFNNGSVYKCPIHTDHDYEHKQLLLYLNDATGDTIILDENDKVFKVSNPEKYKGICFGRTKHYHYFPITGVRQVAVFTFS